MWDYEYHCRDCCETFTAEAPYFDEPTECPFCHSRDIIPESQHQLNEQINAADEAAEERMRK